MKLVIYNPRYNFPINIDYHRLPGRAQSMSVEEALRLYEELGDVLKKIPPEEHEDIRFGGGEDRGK